jgi:hypothetical protein
MTKDPFERSKSALEGKASEKSNGIAVDDMGIPILEEILTQKSDTDSGGEVETSKPATSDTSLANNEELVTELREQLKSQVNSGIDEIAERVAIKVVTSMTSELKQQVQSKLKDILQQNLDEMISKAIDSIPKNS